MRRQQWVMVPQNGISGSALTEAHATPINPITANRAIVPARAKNMGVLGAFTCFRVTAPFNSSVTAWKYTRAIAHSPPVPTAWEEPVVGMDHTVATISARWSPLPSQLQLHRQLHRHRHRHRRFWPG